MPSRAQREKPAVEPSADSEAGQSPSLKTMSPSAAPPSSEPMVEGDLADRAKSAAFELAREARPWRAGQSWGVIGIEGLVALTIGIYAVFQTEDAAGIIRQLIALVLLAVSVGQIVEGFRFRASGVAPWATLRGGVGTTFAALTLLSPLSQYIQGDGSRQLLALGLIAYGVLGIVAVLVASNERDLHAGALVSDVLALVLGFLTFTRQPGEADNVHLFGWAMLLGGVVLLAFAYIIRKRQSREGASAPVARPAVFRGRV